MPNPPEQPRPSPSITGPAFVLFFCCSPSPFGTLTSAEYRNESWPFLLLVFGIELGLLGAIVWLFVRLVRDSGSDPTWWNAIALLILGLLQGTNGMMRFVSGASLFEERLGTPDWGYRVDGAVFVVLGLLAAGLFIREVVRLRYRRNNPADSANTAA